MLVGCNVENAAYGVVLCAECGLVSSLHATGGGRLTHVVCVNGAGDVIMPCGRCRQLLWEHGGAALQLLTPRGVRRMDEVLPDAFGPEDLEASMAPMSASHDAVEVIGAKRDDAASSATARSTGSSTPTRAARSPTSRCRRWRWRSCSTG